MAGRKRNEENGAETNLDRMQDAGVLLKLARLRRGMSIYFNGESDFGTAKLGLAYGLCRRSEGQKSS